MQDLRLRNALFPKRSLARISELVPQVSDVVITDFAAENDQTLSEVEVLVTGWGAPVLDAETLKRMPKLRLICHAGGSVKEHLNSAVWDRGIAVTNAAHANAVPVAEFTVALIVLAGKDLLRARYLYTVQQHFVDREAEFANAGNYGKTIGIIGASTIGRLVIGLLNDLDAEILLYDPTVSDAEAQALQTRKADLKELLCRSDIVSLHAPLLPETEGMLGAEELALLHDGACLINTARGKLVDHRALRAELQNGRITAYLDVTDPEPLLPGDPLYSLHNVLLTPHIAGAMGTELHRLGAAVVTEIERYVSGLPLLRPVIAGDLTTTA